MKGSLKPFPETLSIADSQVEQTEALLVFLVGTAQLGIPAEFVQEVCDRGEASPIPLSPAHIVGLMSLRGEAVPLLDLHVFLKVDVARENSEVPRPPRVIVARAEGMTAGLCVDRVLGIEHLSVDHLVAPTIHVGSALAKYVTAECDRDRGVLGRMNLGALFRASRMIG